MLPAAQGYFAGPRRKSRAGAFRLRRSAALALPATNNENVMSKHWRKASCLGGLGLALLSLGGCQTWTAGMNLPSPRYLEHPPQYFEPSPPFPLPRELATQEAAAGVAPGFAVGPVGGVAAGVTAPGAPVMPVVPQAGRPPMPGPGL
jgi:hypothetical protein